MHADVVPSACTPRLKLQIGVQIRVHGVGRLLALLDPQRATPAVAWACCVLLLPIWCCRLFL